ncbi:MAG TPA: purine-nucleoside phosphorylase [Bacteroidia bacterium]|nr:purine-nucleoside phosphorylase [Bacteroidia bacterium]HNT80660.1 purine-nucleoside phosphorylase [Bacteroidia bacterium]
MLKKVKEIVSHLQAKTNFIPDTGIVLGSGLGALVDAIQDAQIIPYENIPGFPVSTVKGHKSNLYLGTIGKSKVMVMQGRFHFYEGYGFEEITLPIRVMKLMGIQKLIVSNAAGGMNPDFKVGDLMFINDHINLLPGNPLIGPNIEELGPRFPDMSVPYDPALIAQAVAIAEKNKFRFHTGVYAAVSGPTFETPAEYRYLYRIGADAVGMSTVPEVITARHMGVPCFAASVITDLGGGDHVEPVSHEEVLKVANAAEQKLTAIVKEMLS